MTLPLLLMVAAAECDPEWSMEEVTSTTGVITSTELVLDSADQPHLTYIVGSKVVHASRDADGWSMDTLSTESSSAVAIDLFSTDLPAIAYVESFYPHEVNYAFFDGGSWHTESVGAVLYGTQDVCLAMDGEDVPRIVYHSYVYMNPYNANTALRFCTRGTSGWEDDLILSYNTVEDGLVYNFDMELTTDGGHPVVTYSAVYYSTTRSLDYAWPDQRPEYWNWLSITSYHEVEFENSLDRDPNGMSHCTYRRYGNLYYAAGDTTGFSAGIVDAGDDVAAFSDVGGDGQSIPHIVYDAPDGLRYATRPESSWLIETLCTSSGNILSPSIRLDPEDNPHVAWIETGSINRVMYACCDESSGASTHQYSPAYLTFEGIIPNPVHGIASAEFALAEQATVVHGIYSLDGRLVWQHGGLYPAGGSSMPLPGLENGAYVYRMQVQDQMETRLFTVCR